MGEQGKDSRGFKNRLGEINSLFHDELQPKKLGLGTTGLGSPLLGT